MSPSFSPAHWPEMLRIGRDGATAILTIERESAGNSVNVELAVALRAAVAGLEGDPALRAVVLTGAGEKFFCAGGDVKAYRAIAGDAAFDRAFGPIREALDRIEALPVPVVAAVNGLALGGGAELLLATDIRLAARHARIGFAHTRLGLIPGYDGLGRLARDVGHARAMRLLLLGEEIDADTAARFGLIDSVVDADVKVAAMALAARFADAAPAAVAAAKRALKAAYEPPLALSRPLARRLFRELWFAADHREAEAAMAERRTPRFVDPPPPRRLPRVAPRPKHGPAHRRTEP